MLHYHDPAVQNLLKSGSFGLEKESLRIHADGSFAQTDHPFPDDAHIVRDFCENQLEINTGVSDSPEGALAELRMHDGRVREKLASLARREYLWPFSNPPYIKKEEDIPVARFYGEQTGKTSYRHHLAAQYGKYKMTFSGIHVNYSLGEDLLRQDFSLSAETDYRRYKDRVYLGLAGNLIQNGWLVNVLLSASPLLDGSYFSSADLGETVFSGMASVRGSELGYWNHFVPILGYESIEAYTGSIRAYMEKGLLRSQSELYYPVRLKSSGASSLDELDRTGVNHIELRNVDLNPYAGGGLDERDLKFLHLLFIYDLCREVPDLHEAWQITAAANFKNAAHYDIDQARILSPDGRSVPVREAALRLLGGMDLFFMGKIDEAGEVIAYQREKLTREGLRYAERVKEDFSEGFVEKGLERLLS